MCFTEAISDSRHLRLLRRLTERNRIDQPSARGPCDGKIIHRLVREVNKGVATMRFDRVPIGDFEDDGASLPRPIDWPLCQEEESKVCVMTYVRMC